MPDNRRTTAEEIIASAKRNLGVMRASLSVVFDKSGEQWHVLMVARDRSDNWSIVATRATLAEILDYCNSQNPTQVSSVTNGI